jgi:site-specific recombinase XerD
VTVSEANEALLESWRLSLHAKSPRTVQLYDDAVRRFARWLTAADRPNGAAGDLTAVQRADVEAWFTAQRAEGLAPATIRSRWIALRNLYGWATDEDEIDPNPMARVKVEKPSPPPVEVLTAEQLRALLNACKGTDFNARRDLAIVRVLAATGLRVSELVDLTAADLDLPNRVLTVRHGKGDRSRLSRFDPETAAALDRYKRARGRHRLAARPELWIGHRGPLTRKGVPRILAKRADGAGIGHVHPHQLRHTWADRWLAAGGTEGDLQRLGGWESPTVMRRYGAVRATDRALAAYDQVDPMGSL